MSRKIFLLLLSSLALSGTLAPAQGAAPESLYHPGDARKIDAGKQSMFGPQAGRFRYDARMLRAAEIAAARARKRSSSRCWGYVKDALVAADAVTSRPVTAYAKQAATELSVHHGFKKIRERNPYKAPLGAVLVYGGRGAGHVEFRTRRGFVSDFSSTRPSPRPLIGIYVKPRA